MGEEKLRLLADTAALDVKNLGADRRLSVSKWNKLSYALTEKEPDRAVLII